MPEKNMIAPEAKDYDELFQKQLDNDAKQRLKNQWNRSDLYKKASNFLSNNSVIELGCGDGFLTNFIGKKKYIGIDFCKVLIKNAKKLYPDKTFIVGDLRNKKIHDMFDLKNSYVCLEVLEHINNDLEVIEKIPKGCEFIFSVPSADNNYHVRYFKSFDEIKNRYKNHLKYINQDVFPTKYGNVIRILKTIKI